MLLNQGLHMAPLLEMLGMPSVRQGGQVKGLALHVVLASCVIILIATAQDEPEKAPEPPHKALHDTAGMWQQGNTQAQHQCVLDAAKAGAMNGWVTTPELDKLYGMCLTQRKLAI